MTTVMIEAVKVMGIGMGTVFFILLIFFGMIKALQAVFPAEDNE